MSLKKNRKHFVGKQFKCGYRHQWDASNTLKLFWLNVLIIFLTKPEFFKKSFHNIYWEFREGLWLQGEAAFKMHSFRDAEPQSVIPLREALKNPLNLWACSYLPQTPPPYCEAINNNGNVWLLLDVNPKTKFLDIKKKFQRL